MGRFAFLAALALLLTGAPAWAEVRTFENGSLAQIRAQRQGKPFILSFWSLDCAHCPQELKALGELKKRYPKVDIVLVSTDSPEAVEALASFAAQKGLTTSEQWVFAATQPQRLRYEVDPRWWGELPRTYFHDAEHRIDAVSGVVPMERLKRWVKEQGR
jgi:thiol-disulfide isomerase/thioredoxin